MIKGTTGRPDDRGGVTVARGKMRNGKRLNISGDRQQNYWLSDYKLTATTSLSEELDNI